MPRKRKIITTEETIVQGSDHEEATDTEEEEETQEELTPEEMKDQAVENQIEDICAEIGDGGGAVTVLRQPPNGLKFEYADKMSLDDFKASGMEEIKRRFGGGTYRLRITDGKNKIRGQVLVSIDKRLKGELDGVAAPAGNGKAMEALAEEMSRKSGDFGQIMLQMMSMQQQQQQQTLQMMTTLMAQPKGSSMKDISGILAPFIPLAVKLIEGRAQDGTTKTIEMLLKAKELFGGDGGGGEGSGNVLEKMLTSFAPIVAAKLQQQPAAPGPVVETGAPGPIPGNVVQLEQPQLPPVQPQLNPEDPEMWKKLVVGAIRGQYPKLVKAAQKGTEPQSYFDVLMDDLEDQPPAILGALIEILQQPTWIKDLFAVDQVSDPKWFGELRQAFLDWAKGTEGPGKEEEAPAAPAAPVQQEPEKKAAGGKK